MSRFKIFFSCVLLAGLTFTGSWAQNPATIKIDLDRKIGEVDPFIYGEFLEAMVAYRGVFMSLSLLWPMKMVSEPTLWR